MSAEPPATPEARFDIPFFFLRHGETVFNRERLFQGQKDTELSALGHQQAAKAGEAMADQRIDRIVSSPLSRARLTAEAVAAHHGLPVETDDDLMECHLGIHQGEPYAPWMPEYWRGAFHPEGGESFWQFRARTWPAMARAAAVPNTLIVAHGGLWYGARSLVRMEPDIPSMPNCLPLRIRPEPGRWQVERLAEPYGATEQRFGPSAGQGA
ncbi:MAG: histidine phosphatase family protein [Pseudomonadota bacterium]